MLWQLLCRHAGEQYHTGHVTGAHTACILSARWPSLAAGCVARRRSHSQCQRTAPSDSNCMWFLAAVWALVHSFPCADCHWKLPRRTCYNSSADCGTSFQKTLCADMRCSHFLCVKNVVCCEYSIRPVWGRGTPLPPLSIYFLIFSPFTFPFLSLALPIFFFCPSLPFLPE